MLPTSLAVYYDKVVNLNDCRELLSQSGLYPADVFSNPPSQVGVTPFYAYDQQESPFSTILLPSTVRTQKTHQRKLSCLNCQLNTNKPSVDVNAIGNGDGDGDDDDNDNDNDDDQDKDKDKDADVKKNSKKDSKKPSGSQKKLQCCRCERSTHICCSKRHLYPNIYNILKSRVGREQLFSMIPGDSVDFRTTRFPTLLATWECVDCKRCFGCGLHPNTQNDDLDFTTTSPTLLICQVCDRAWHPRCTREQPTYGAYEQTKEINRKARMYSRGHNNIYNITAETPATGSSQMPALDAVPTAFALSRTVFTCTDCQFVSSLPSLDDPAILTELQTLFNKHRTSKRKRSKSYREEADSDSDEKRKKKKHSRKVDKDK